MSLISVIKDDITKLAVDAIVNAANKSLLGGGGVDGVIHFAAGPQLLRECIELNGCNTGEAKITKGYNLPAKFIIHTVGPVYGNEDGHEEELLKACYLNSLLIAKDNGIKTIAYPCISTGVFRFPKDEAVLIAIDTVKSFISKHPNVLEEIIFVTHEELDFNIYNRYFLRDVVKRVISQNKSLGYHPEIIIFQTKNGEAENLELVISDLVKNKNTEESIIETIKKYGQVLTIEDLIVESKNRFGLPEDVITEASRRKVIFDWWRSLQQNKDI